MTPHPSMPEKAFLVFGYDQFYPNGGWNDYLGRFETLELAKEFIAAKGDSHNYYDVINLRLVGDTGELRSKGEVYSVKV